ncbi:12927_t:CDS:2 [Entrophospora sp. SA101]|nr:10281_t:CDS:2 [Entrophospora sp. SA101]CAJ0828620.1 14858_t:CDS:2 [Entrophospora sp. SA101]CAJ0831151.1 12927_t:CDS:2 [Entrophospora sp. SA101]CAJ0860800.1 3036_t:CDS:2 [Entrophospora sp. SA101]
MSMAYFPKSSHNHSLNTTIGEMASQFRKLPTSMLKDIEKYLIKDTASIYPLLILRDPNTMLGSLFTIAKLSNGETIAIYVPSLGKAQIVLVENNANSDLPPAQLIFYLTLLNEIAKQIPNFGISNVELAKVFTNP